MFPQYSVLTEAVLKFATEGKEGAFGFAAIIGADVVGAATAQVGLARRIRPMCIRCCLLTEIRTLVVSLTWFP